MHPVNLLELDDEPSSDGIHLTEKQRLDAFERIWAALSPADKLDLKCRTPHAT